MTSVGSFYGFHAKGGAGGVGVATTRAVVVSSMLIPGSGRVLGGGPAMSILLRDVHRAFGRNQVLRGLDLEVLDGETLSVIGFSGAGKSVVLKHMVGLIRPDSGDVVVDGQNVSELDVRELKRTPP